MTAARASRSFAAMTTTLHRIRDERLAAGLALLLTAAALAFANFQGGEDAGGVGPYAICVAVCAVVAAVLFGRTLPDTADPARAGWILGGLALLTCAVFWSGLPFVLGMGAIYSAGRAERSGPAVVGALAIVAAFVACVAG